MANTLFSSRLDYCNLFFKSLSKFNLHKLQCIQNSAARIISNTGRYTSITPVLKKLRWLPVEHHSVFLKKPPLFTSFFTLVFPSILLHITLPTVPGAVRVVVNSLSFQCSNPVSKNLLSSLVTVLFLMPPLFGMLFLMRFVHPKSYPLSESRSKPTCTPRHTHLSLTHPMAFSVVLGLSSVPGY